MRHMHTLLAVLQNNSFHSFRIEMLQRTTFLLSALLLLILANVLMMTYGSPVFRPTAEGFSSYMQKQGFTDGSMDEEEEKVEGPSSEGFTSYSGSPAGAKTAYQPMGPFDGVNLAPGKGAWRYTAPNEPLNGYYPPFKVGPDNLFMFKDNQAKPECCGSSFSSDMGCVCSTPEQRDYINMRGGNRTPPDADPGV